MQILFLTDTLTADSLTLSWVTPWEVIQFQYLEGGLRLVEYIELWSKNDKSEVKQY